MSNPRPKILLTGFGPFPSVAENATAQLVPELAARAAAEFQFYAVEHEILPTEWNAAPARVQALIAMYQPVLALHFGVAREALGFRIETHGRNTCNLAADACGVTPQSLKLLTEGPDAHAVPLPTGEIVGRLLHLGLPAYVSEDAGSYLCNAVLYHSLATGCRSGFIHVPADLSGQPLTLAEAISGSLEILRLCLSQNAPAQMRA